MIGRRGNAPSDGRQATVARMTGRWKRGLAATVFMAIAAVAALLAVGVPMFIIGETLNYPSFQSLSNIAPIALLLALPWIVTSNGVARAISEMLDSRNR